MYDSVPFWVSIAIAVVVILVIVERKDSLLDQSIIFYFVVFQIGQINQKIERSDVFVWVNDEVRRKIVK